jgi:5-methylcytosine-specific restriction endonuclease McrA
VPYDASVKPHLVFERDGYRCHICKKKALPKYIAVNGRAHPRSPTVDHHPYPLSAGVKGHEWDNVRCACWLCNVRKGAAWSGQRVLFR